MAHPQALPQVELAVIPTSKLEAYVLNPAHDVGGHKARLFASILGFHAGNHALLASAILAGLPQVPALPRGRNQHGELYQVDVPVTGPKGSATVRTGWILRHAGGPPTLTTALVLKAKP